MKFFSTGLLLAALGWQAQAQPVLPAPAEPLVETRYVLVTNVVLVTITNYVVTTNLVFSTNSFVTRTTNTALPDLSWVPPTDDFDWIQLKSGEWLKGRLKAMQSRKLEFDSKELDDLTFDWKDIRQLRSAQTQDVLFADRESFSGRVTATPDLITVEGAEPHTFPRSELQSITPGGSKEVNYWSGKLSVGLALRGGNTKSADYSSQISLQRRTPETRFMFDYLGNVSSVDDVENANNHRASVEFDYWVSRKLYLILPQAEYFRDPFQNIGARVSGGVGVGYDLIARPGLEWNISAGPGYTRTWYDSVTAGQAPSAGAAALIFGTRFDWEITQRIDLILEYGGQYTGREVGETTHHSVSTLSIELTRRLDLDVSFIWDRIQQPKPEANGTVPDQNDYRLTVGLGVDF